MCVCGTEQHMNCDKPFDGHGGELAHSWTGGDVHFDEDENYKRDDPTGTGINLLKVGLLHYSRLITVNWLLIELCHVCNDDRLRSTQRGNFSVVRTRTKLADGAFTVAGPAAWNVLLSDLRNSASRTVFIESQNSPVQ